VLLKVHEHSVHIELGPPVSYLDNDGVDMLQLNALNIHHLNSNDNILAWNYSMRMTFSITLRGRNVGEFDSL
jgi:hypothetical protein